MTEPGLTDNYSVSDHINAIIEHSGEGLIDYCLYDTGEVVPEYIKKYNLDGAELVEQDISEVKDKKIKFIKENLSIIKQNYVRHNSMIIADTLIKIICDDLKFKDKHNDYEYIMMNSKLQADKEIQKNMKRNLKNKNKTNKDNRRYKSKFASKYSERIESIKNSNEEQIKKKKNKANIKKNELNQINKKRIDEMRKKKEEFLKAYNESIKRN